MIHVAQVARAGWGNFRSMVTGYEVVPVGAVAADPILPTAANGTVPVALDEPPLPRQAPEPEPQAKARIRQMSRRSFLYGGIAALVGLGAWRWLAHQSGDEGVPPFLRGLVASHNDEEKGHDPDQKQKAPDQK